MLASGRRPGEPYLNFSLGDADRRRTPHSALDGHVGKADVASLVGAAESAP